MPIRAFTLELERSSSVVKTAASGFVDTAAFLRREHRDVVRTADAAARGAGDTVEG
ncbi:MULTISPECIES: hypothetical protein [unclassified Rathayibacter]|jgi:hypothetical protein|uniref:hypothetical protein n=1 Tax=unclassified Rathayibacter TaxID=2609250 RepID=UPI0015E2B874|nr:MULTISPECIES: hypothetical protein [unclassified Rathayibacter]